MRRLRDLLVGLVLLSGSARLLAADDPKAVEFFENKIRPVLIEQCVKCHSDAAEKGKKLRGGLKLDSKAAWQKGGDTGAAIVPSKPSEGTLLKSLKYDGELQMPPAGKLPANVQADFEKWIKDGAVDPRDGNEEKSKSGIDFEKAKQFWSLQPPKSQTVPKVENPKVEIRNPIDAFIQAKWNEKGLIPTTLADKRTRIRRLTLDLTGLPPTPEEVETFLKDESAKAWTKAIDRLLESPRYGERWGRYWLDVARYAEDQAHTFSVTPKKGAYLYRDWVIQAFNQDMPYDRFVKLQLAGDLMPETDEDLFTRIAGMGLMGLGADYYKNTAREQAIAEELDDRVDTLTRGFLGLTVACARCHDHKFDPIPTKDYYALAGIFNGTNLSDTPLVGKAELKTFNDAQEKVKNAEGAVNAYLIENGKAASKAALPLTAKYLIAARTVRATKGKAEETAKKQELNPYFLAKWVKFLDPANAVKTISPMKEFFALKADASVEEVEKAAEAVQSKLASLVGPEKEPAKKQPEPLLKILYQDQNAPLFVNAGDAEKLFLSADAKKKLTELRAEVEKLKKASPPPPLMAHVLSGGGQEMKVYIRGNPATKGEAAPKGFLRVLASTNAKPVKDFTRLDLANAIASAENPLTARVIVNRVWAWHFGRGLVNTPSNFGALGERPTHPELLDYLATEFVKHGWSLKWLHRQILNSSTFQLASNSESKTDDGANAYLARGNTKRLDVEAWRDSLLFVSGNLDTTLGGPTYDLRDPNSKRRTIYAKVSRHELDGLLRMFDFPDANVTADKRNVTTVPQQQLFALNSEFMVNQAKAFSTRLEKLGKTDAERIKAAYRIAFNRPPDSREVELSERFLKLPMKPDDKLTRWQQYAQILLASNELMYVD